jgi:meiotic recombination protein DMC1
VKPNGAGFMTSGDLAHVRKRCFRISTGSKQWDSILNEGFQSCSISEVYGEFRQYHSAVCC